MKDFWYDVDSWGNEEDETIISEYDITVSPNDFNISTVFSLIDNGIVKLPVFQRHYVWSKLDASRLIESIILGLPIPQVFLYEKGKNNFLIIDGQQRLLSIYFFIKQRFPNDEGRKRLREFLSGDDSISKGFLSDDKYFTNFALHLPSQIPSEKNKLDQLKFETLDEYKHSFEFLRTIRSVVIKQNEPEDSDSSMYEIFNRLNTGGQKLKAQEIRMSLYYSHFYKMLFDINTLSVWRLLLNQQTADLNFKDIEILLRAFAMLFNFETYTSPMTKFLNHFSKLGSSFDQTTQAYLKALFASFLDSTLELEARSFLNQRGKFNISLFESVFVAVCLEAFRSKQLITGHITPESFKSLKGDPDFIKASQSSVGSKANVSIRILRAIELIRLM